MDVQTHVPLRTLQWQEAKRGFLITNETQIRLAIGGLLSKMAYRVSYETDTSSDMEMSFFLPSGIDVELGDDWFCANVIRLSQMKFTQDRDSLMFDLNLAGEYDSATKLQEGYETEVTFSWRDGSLALGDTLMSWGSDLEV